MDEEKKRFEEEKSRVEDELEKERLERLREREAFDQERLSSKQALDEERAAQEAEREQAARWREREAEEAARAQTEADEAARAERDAWALERNAAAQRERELAASLDLAHRTAQDLTCRADGLDADLHAALAARDTASGEAASLRAQVAALQLKLNQFEVAPLPPPTTSLRLLSLSPPTSLRSLPCLPQPV